MCWWICQITNQRLDKGHMCASLCVSPTHLPHIPLHICVKNPISRNVRIVGSAVVTSWQAVRSNNKASAPVSSWLHQLRDTSLWINDTHSSPASCSLHDSSNIRYRQATDMSETSYSLKKKKGLISTPSDRAASNQIYLPAGNKRPDEWAYIKHRLQWDSGLFTCLRWPKVNSQT